MLAFVNEGWILNFEIIGKSTEGCKPTLDGFDVLLHFRGVTAGEEPMTRDGAPNGSAIFCTDTHEMLVRQRRGRLRCTRCARQCCGAPPNENSYDMRVATTQHAGTVENAVFTADGGDNRIELLPLSSSAPFNIVRKVNAPMVVVSATIGRMPAPSTFERELVPHD